MFKKITAVFQLMDQDLMWCLQSRMELGVPEMGLWTDVCEAGSGSLPRRGLGCSAGHGTLSPA